MQILLALARCHRCVVRIMNTTVMTVVLWQCEPALQQTMLRTAENVKNKAVAQQDDQRPQASRRIKVIGPHLNYGHVDKGDNAQDILCPRCWNC